MGLALIAKPGEVKFIAFYIAINNNYQYSFYS
jgi:hypothetical protein